MLHTDELKITPLGAGNEVGRSCIHVSYRTLNLLLDCGVHPAYTGISSLPFLDLIDLSTIDAIFITHFHLDHAGALPYLTEKTDFKGQVFMTHPTKAILKWLLNDYIRIINANSEIDFYTEDDLNNCYEKIISIDYHQSVVVKNFSVTALNAGHVLGAAMFLIENDRLKLLYTGDYSTEEDRHLKGADTEWINKYGDSENILDVLICESTYGLQCHLPREEREKRFTQMVNDIVVRGGKCLLPVFALGRAQELLLILEDFWERNQRLQRVPIYYASALANRCLSIYQAYAHMMNAGIKKDAFSFKHIKNLKNIENNQMRSACVVMASPGMLQSGLSRELFEMWCEDSRNGTIIAGYCVQGTLAKEILNEPKEIIAMSGQKLRLNMKVEYISFSAHVDYVQNTSFIQKCKPRVVMLVHGEANEMGRLKTAIENNFSVETMRNGETHTVQVRRESVAVGKDLTEGEIKGLVVSDTAGITILKEDELKLKICQRVRLPGLLKKIDDVITKDQKNLENDTTEKEEKSPEKLQNNENIEKDQKNLENNTPEKEEKSQNNENIEKDQKNLENDTTEKEEKSPEKIQKNEDTEKDQKNLKNNTTEKEEKEEKLQKNENIEKENLNQVKIDNVFNATPNFIKKLLLNHFPSIEIQGNSLIIQNIQVSFEDDIYLIYECGYINDMLACTIIRLIENITTKENVQLCKISKKSAIVKVLKNHFDVVEGDNEVEIFEDGKKVILNEKGIKGDGHLMDKVKVIIKKVINIM